MRLWGVFVPAMNDEDLRRFLAALGAPAWPGEALPVCIRLIDAPTVTWMLTGLSSRSLAPPRLIRIVIDRAGERTSILASLRVGWFLYLAVGFLVAAAIGAGLARGAVLGGLRESGARALVSLAFALVVTSRGPSSARAMNCELIMNNDKQKNSSAGRAKSRGFI